MIENFIDCLIKLVIYKKFIAKDYIVNKFCLIFLRYQCRFSNNKKIYIVRKSGYAFLSIHDS